MVICNVGVIPAKAGTHLRPVWRWKRWIPAFAGMTNSFEGNEERETLSDLTHHNRKILPCRLLWRCGAVRVFRLGDAGGCEPVHAAGSVGAAKPDDAD